MFVRVISMVCLGLLILGCRKPTVEFDAIKSAQEVLRIQNQVADAFNHRHADSKSLTPWFHERKDKVPLVIIATAYIDNKAIKTYEYAAFKKFIKKLESDIFLLDKLSGKPISEKFSSITFIDYDTSNIAKERFNAAYRYRNSPKDILTDAIRPNVEKVSAEMMIRLNYKELQRGNLTIEGYKTIKGKNQPRNSYYYHLRKENYADLNQEEKNRAIAKSLIAVLQLSIPEYTTIDRKAIVKDGDLLRFLIPQSKAAYRGVVYSHESDTDIKKMKKRLSTLKAVQKKGYELLTKNFHPQTFMPAKKFDIKFLPNKRYALTIFKSELLYWNLETGVFRRLQGHTDDINFFSVSKDGRYALTASDDKTVRIWNLILGKSEAILKGHTHSVYTVDISDDGKFAISSDARGYVNYWDLVQKKLIRSAAKGPYATFSSDGKSVITTSGYMRKFYISRLPALQATQIVNHRYMRDSLGIGPNLSLVKFNISDDKKYAMIGIGKQLGMGGTGPLWPVGVRLIEIKSGKLLQSFEDANEPEVVIDAVALSRDNKFLATGGMLTDKIKIWSVDTGKVIQVFKTNGGGAQSIDFSEDGTCLAVATMFDVTYWKIKLSEQDRYRLKHYPEKIKKMEYFTHFREDLSEQIIDVTPLQKNDITVLKEAGYVSVKNQELFSLKDVLDMATALKKSFLDPVITKVFESYREKVKAVTQDVGVALQIVAQDHYSASDIYLSSEFDYKESGYDLLYEQKDIKDVSKAVNIIEKDY